MKLLKNILMISLLFIAIQTPFVQAKVIPYEETTYSMQASEELIKIAEEAAAIAGFTSDYEIFSPKKAALHINPWNRFIAHGINPVTKNPFITINPEWFGKISKDEQLFLLVRCFTTFLSSKANNYRKIIPYSLYILEIPLMVLIWQLLKKTPLTNYHTILKVIITIGALFGSELLLLDPLQSKFARHLNRKYENNIIKIAVEKTQNRDAAIKALEYFDSSIKEELKNDEQFFAPLKHAFEYFANNLKEESIKKIS